MTRLPRVSLARVPQMVAGWGLDHRAVFADHGDRLFFLQCLQHQTTRHHIAVHGFGLQNHGFMVVLTPDDATSLSACMRAWMRQHSAYFNRRQGRSGTLWHGRYQHALLLDSPQAPWPLWAVLWAELQTTANQSPWAQAECSSWSSAHHHTGLGQTPWLSPLPRYWALGNTPFAREAAWATLLQDGLPTAVNTRIRKALQSGTALGEPEEVAALQAQLPRRISPLRAGRPRKAVSPTRISPPLSE